MIHVVTTGWQTEGAVHLRCLQSFQRQEGVESRQFISIASPAFPTAHFEFLTSTISKLDPHDVVVSLDADDEFSTPSALAIIARAHELGAWVTYGSYRLSDGRPGHAAPGNPDTCRKDPWVMSHTKSFRAGLFQRIRPEHLKMGGEWLPHGRDLALMFPMAEMAGPAHCIFLPQVTYVYHLEASGEWTGGREFQKDERRCVEYVRSIEPYRRLALPLR